MDRFFCADASQQADEDLIGTGMYSQTYILIECPYPWADNALESEAIPAELRSAIAQAKAEKPALRCLLISRDQTRTSTEKRVLIYHHDSTLFHQNYRKREFQVTDLTEAAQVIQDYLAGQPSAHEAAPTATRDILVCTHGSHDQCCARYGNPFFSKATTIVGQLKLDQVQVWRSSHFGGHRFAPTAIDLPEGRYYGRLDVDAFKSILTRSGKIQCFQSMYRGWSVLPLPVQVLERSLILQFGWEWFDCQVACRVLEQAADGNIIQAELLVQKPDGTIQACRGTIVKDDTKTVHLKGSCCAQKQSEFVKYTVKSLMLYSDKLSPGLAADEMNSGLIEVSSQQQDSPIEPSIPRSPSSPSELPLP